MGTLAAFYAVKRNPNMLVLLVDRGFIGGGTTRHSIGFDYPFGHTKAKKEMAIESLLLWQQLDTHLQNLRCTLPLYGIVSKKNTERVLNGFVQNNFQTDEKTLVFNKTTLLAKKEHVFITGGYCNYYKPQATTEKLAELIKKQHNCTIWEGLNVERVETQKSSFNLHLSDQNTIKTNKLLLATGPWSATNGLGLFEETKLRTKKIISLHIEEPTEQDCPALFFFDEDAFLLPLVTLNRLIFSFTILSWDIHPDSNAFVITPEEKEIGVSILRKYLPNLVNKCHGGRVFCDAYSPDWTPIIQRNPVYPNAVIATAGSGSGFRLAPAIAIRALNHLGI